MQTINFYISTDMNIFVTFLTYLKVQRFDRDNSLNNIVLEANKNWHQKLM